MFLASGKVVLLLRFSYAEKLAASVNIIIVVVVVAVVTIVVAVGQS